jgi:hypothetical protein
MRTLLRFLWLIAKQVGEFLLGIAILCLFFAALVGFAHLVSLVVPAPQDVDSDATWGMLVMMLAAFFCMAVVGIYKLVAGVIGLWRKAKETQL